VETGGEEHHVHVFLAGSQNFECEWYARKKLFADMARLKAIDRQQTLDVGKQSRTRD